MRRTVVPLITAIVLLAGASPASAATFVVTTTTDPASPGTCSGASCPTIRAALVAAFNNGVTTQDTIVVPNDTTTLAERQAEAGRGQLEITSDVILAGTNAVTTIIAGDTKNFRVVNVQAGRVFRLQHLTVKNGAATASADGVGGGVRVGAGANATLDHVRITGNKALRGGGLGVVGGSATVTYSLIDTNGAVSGGTGPSADAGGIMVLGGAGAPSTLTLTDSTVARNTASVSAGIVARDSSSNSTTLDRVTIAYNSGGSTGGAGLFIADAEPFSVKNSIVASNTGDGVPSNCNTTSFTDLGGNIDSGTTCGMKLASDRENTNPLLSTLFFSDGGDVPVLTIPSNSPAVDLAGTCSGFDQRDVTRPQGPACDSGAYEFDKDPDTAINSGPMGLTNNNAPSFTFSSPEPGVTFECRLDGTAANFAACSSPKAYTGVADGSHTFFVRAVDATGHSDATPASRAFTVDATAPDTTITGGPSGATTVTNPSFTFNSPDGGTSFQCRLDTPAGTGSYSACTSPQAYSTAANGAYTFFVRSTDAAGNQDPTAATRSFTVDTVAPDTTITAGPSGATNGTNPSFTFNSPDGGISFQCKLDTPAGAGSYTACTSPQAYTTTANGAYTFSVRATDAAGNQDASPATRAFTVDTVAPDTTITGGPSGATNGTNPSFTFNSPDGGISFQCKLDTPAGAGTYTACTSPQAYTTTANGAYTFSVRATDAAGNQDASPATRAFTVDTVAPDTTITAGPSGATNGTNPSFTFNSPDGGISFQCKLDTPAGAGTYTACTSPQAYTTTANGAYTFSVRATDAAGNQDASPATRAFTVDTVAPDTIINSGPPAQTNGPSPQFTFSSPDGGTSFQCKLDGPGATTGSYASCTSPNTRGPLTDGAYTFSVRSTDAAGNQDASPATRAFTVDTVAPNTTIDSGPTGTTGDNTPTFAFSSPDGGTLFQCKLDGPGATTGNYASCSSPRTLNPLPDGTFTASVRAIDQAGNVDLSPATRTFTVDTGPPDTTIDDGPEGPTATAAPKFTFSSTEAGSTFQCKLDGPAAAPGTYAACSSPRTLGPLADGTYTFSVRATDAVGNPDASPATRAFVVDTTPPPAAVGDGPSGATTNSSPAFTFSSSDAGSTFECRLDGVGGAGIPGTYQACVSPKSFNALAPGAYTFFVRAVDAAGNRSAAPAERAFTVTVAQQATPTPTPTPAGTPTPQFHKTVVIAPVSGKVLVRIPPSKKFVAVDAAKGIPLGAEVDTRKGVLQLTSVPKSGGTPQTAKFWDGLFKVTQPGGITQLALSEPLASCKAKKASIAAKKPKTRKLWGDGSGSFRTRGQYSAATVRGTKWLVQDSCAGTLTRVVKGVVAVNDLVKRKTVLVKAGKRYTARPKAR